MDYIFNKDKDIEIYNDINIITYDPINNTDNKQYIKDNKTFI